MPRRLNATVGGEDRLIVDKIVEIPSELRLDSLVDVGVSNPSDDSFLVSSGGTFSAVSSTEIRSLIGLQAIDPDGQTNLKSLSLNQQGGTFFANFRGGNYLVNLLGTSEIDSGTYSFQGGTYAISADYVRIPWFTNTVKDTSENDSTANPEIYIGNPVANNTVEIRHTLGVIWSSGEGAPTHSASPGSLYTRTGGGAGTTLYVKESGTDGNGWVGK